MNLDQVCRNPIFIIGSPRSGTTALAHALGMHPELWVSKESYFLHQLYGAGRASGVWSHNWKRATPSWLRHEGVEREEFMSYLGLGMNALMSSRSGGRRWVDQTPLYTLMVHDLADMFPDAQFVHIMRDGRSVVRSMSEFQAAFDADRLATITDEIPAWAHDFATACDTWSRWVDTAFDFERTHPERCITIRNEELALDPPSGFTRLCSFLNIAMDDAPVERFEGPLVNSSFKGDPARRAEQRRAFWTMEHRKTFAELAGPTLVRAEYLTHAELGAWTDGEADDR